MKRLALCPLAALALVACEQATQPAAVDTSISPPSFSFVNAEITITDLGTLGGNSQAVGINNSGEVTGNSADPNKPSTARMTVRAFIFLSNPSGI